MKRVAASLPIIVLALLAGCAPAPEPSPTGPSATPAPTASPADEVESGASGIVIATRGIMVMDNAGMTIDSFSYFDDPLVVIDAFSELLGGQPVVTPFEAEAHFLPGNTYTWDSFRVSDYVGGVGMPYGEEFTVVSTAPEVRGIRVETVEGIAVGDSSAVAEAHMATSGVSVFPSGSTPGWLQVDLIDVDEFDESHMGEAFAFVSVSVSNGTVSQLSAPGINFGP